MVRRTTLCMIAKLACHKHTHTQSNERHGLLFRSATYRNVVGVVEKSSAGYNHMPTDDQCTGEEDPTVLNAESITAAWVKVVSGKGVTHVGRGHWAWHMPINLMLLRAAVLGSGCHFMALATASASTKRKQNRMEELLPLHRVPGL